MAAISRFDEALRRPCQPVDADYIRFKRNLAVIEAGNDAKFESDLADKIHQPKVDGDWLLLAAANDLLQGAFIAGAEHLRHAAQVLPPSGFAEKVADFVFQSQSHVPNLAPILTAAKITEPAVVVPPSESTKPTSAAATGSSASKTPPPPDIVSDAPMIPTPVAPVSNDPAVWSIEKADPGAWPAPSVSMAH